MAPVWSAIRKLSPGATAPRGRAGTWLRSRSGEVLPVQCAIRGVRNTLWSREGDPATKPVSRGAVLLRHSHRNRIARGPIDRHLYRKGVSRRCVARDYGVDLPDAH